MFASSNVIKSYEQLGYLAFALFLDAHLKWMYQGMKNEMNWMPM